MKILILLVILLGGAVFFCVHKVSSPYKSSSPPDSEVKKRGDEKKDDKVTVSYQFKNRPAFEVKGLGQGTYVDSISNTVVIQCEPSDKDAIMDVLQRQDVFISRIGIRVVVLRIVCSSDDEYTLDAVISKFNVQLTTTDTLLGPGVGVALSSLKAIMVDTHLKGDTRTLIETHSVLSQGVATDFSSTSEQILSNTVTTQTAVSETQDRRQVGLFLTLTPYFLTGQISLNYKIINQTPDSSETVESTTQDGETRLTRRPLVMVDSRRHYSQTSKDHFFFIPVGSSDVKLIQQDIFLIQAEDPSEEEPTLRALPVTGGAVAQRPPA